MKKNNSVPVPESAKWVKIYAQSNKNTENSNMNTANSKKLKYSYNKL